MRTRQEIPEIQVKGSNVSVQQPTFSAIMRSLGLYQNNQGSSSSPEGDGLRIIMYIDDMLIMGESDTLLKDHVKGVVYLLENLGFAIYFPK